MDRLNRVIIALGSNYNAEENITRAVEKLGNFIISVSYAPAAWTEPYGDYPSTALFLNQVAIGFSIYSIEELRTEFKRIEQQAGRHSLELQKGEMPLDIDLLQWNEEVLKPEDMEREYINEAIRNHSCGILSRPMSSPDKTDTDDSTTIIPLA